MSQAGDPKTIATGQRKQMDYSEMLQSEAILTGLARTFFQNADPGDPDERQPLPNMEARYRALVEQIPAVVFMAYLDQGIGEAYVSPQIESSLGFSQREWLEDPVRWYQQIHPDDKDRWSVEAAEMFRTGEPLRSAYRVMARDGRVIWFHCEAKIICDSGGRPWFFHGIGFDISDLKRTEAALADERNVLSTILDTVGALVAVLDTEGYILRFNRACEQATGLRFEEVQNRRLLDLLAPEEYERFQLAFDQMLAGTPLSDHECRLSAGSSEGRLIRWSATQVQGSRHRPGFVIATGVDITEHKRLEQAVLDISDSEQRRIGRDLHDDLGQHLTGIAFLSKAIEQRMKERSLPEAADIAKIVSLVNESISKTRELARDLVLVWKDSQGLTWALQRWANEVQDLFGVTCQFICDLAVPISDENTNNHLYRIAQEAVNNAIKHGKPTRIKITLTGIDNKGVLRVQDNGCGIPKGRNGTGMGLDIMRYRASMIGGVLEITGQNGTLVICTFPV